MAEKSEALPCFQIGEIGYYRLSRVQTSIIMNHFRDHEDLLSQKHKHSKTHIDYPQSSTHSDRTQEPD